MFQEPIQMAFLLFSDVIATCNHNFGQQNWKREYSNIGHSISYTMRNIIEIREIRESSYEISEYVHTFFQKVRKRVQHLEFHQKCVRTLAFTDFLNSCPIICKSLRKLCKSGKIFIVVQLRTFCTSIQVLVMFLVNSNFFVNICSFVQLFSILFHNL